MELMSPDTQWLCGSQSSINLRTNYPETPKLAHSLASLGNPAAPLITTCTQSLGSLTALGLTSFQPQRYRYTVLPGSQAHHTAPQRRRH